MGEKSSKTAGGEDAVGRSRLQGRQSPARGNKVEDTSIRVNDETHPEEIPGEPIPPGLSDDELIDWLARQPRRAPSSEFQKRVMADIRQREPHPRTPPARPALAVRICRWVRALFKS